MKHMGSACNLLVCLEQGPPLELCKRRLRAAGFRGPLEVGITGGSTSISQNIPNIYSELLKLANFNEMRSELRARNF